MKGFKGGSVTNEFLKKQTEQPEKKKSTRSCAIKKRNGSLVRGKKGGAQNLPTVKTRPYPKTRTVFPQGPRNKKKNKKKKQTNTKNKKKKKEKKTTTNKKQNTKKKKKKSGHTARVCVGGKKNKKRKAGQLRLPFKKVNDWKTVRWGNRKKSPRIRGVKPPN